MTYLLSLSVLKGLKMNFMVLAFVIVSLGFLSVECFFRPRPQRPTPAVLGHTGTPLFLTPYLKPGMIKKAQRLSKVHPCIGNSTSFSGYFTTNQKCGNNLFFWFFPAQINWKNAPLVLWLQGGPGASSMYGLFEEIGPFNSFRYGLETRGHSWNVRNNLLFIDQPVGTGYSFTKNRCYAKNQTIIAEELYKAIIQFFKLFPNLQRNSFFISGESFAGHYIPALGHIIHNRNPSAKIKIKLQAMMIGSGWTDPRNQINYGDYLYETGHIDRNQQNEFYRYQKMFVAQVDSGNWSDASSSLNALMGLTLMYAGVDIYNYLPQPTDESNWNDFIQTASTRKAIHVGSQEFYKESYEVYDNLQYNIPQSVKPWVEELLEHYPIIFYGGQLDIVCGYPMIANFLQSLKWSGQNLYLKATREKWYVGRKLAGYIKGQHNLFDVLVRDAGHMVPADQPLWAYQLLNFMTAGNFSKHTTGPWDLW